MADVDDLWFEDDPDDPDKKRPTPNHGKGKRYLARWRDPDGRQRKMRFHRKRDAEQHLAKVETDKQSGHYVDASAGKVTFQVYAEQWRANRTHDRSTSERIERQFRLHAYPDPKKRGRTPSGALAIGHHQIGVLARSPSLMQQWIKSLPLGGNSARLVIRDVGQVFNAAVDDAKIVSNPLASKSIQKPIAVKTQAVAWSGAQVIAVTEALPGHLSAMAPLGASCGHRQGELFAVDADDINFLRKMCHIEWQVKNIHDGQFFALVKNKKTRDVPVADYALFALARHMELYPSVEVTLPLLHPDGRIGPPVTRRLIFTRPDGHAHTRMSANWGWTRARKAAGIPPEEASGMHVLRHTAATNCSRTGCRSP